MKIRECSNLYSSNNVRRGIVRAENLSDELDCATVIVTQVPKMDVQPYDLIELTNENNELEYWLVANYQRKNVSFKPVKYDYVIDLMSITKLLEGIVLPNLAITNIGQNRSILTYIENIMERYFKNEYAGYTISEELKELCQNTICPERTFNEPTLREYLDDLLGFKNCLAKLIFKNRSFELTYLDMNPTGRQLDTSFITSMEQGQTAEQYVTQLEHTLTDVIGQHPIVEYHRLKSDNYLFDTETAKVILHHKPYDIKKIIVKHMPFKILAYLNIEGNGNTIDHATIEVNTKENDGFSTGGLERYLTDFEIDISDYLVIEEVFQSLTTLEQGNFNKLSDELCNGKYQNNTLRWSRGSRNIDNFHYYQTKTTIWENSDAEALTHAVQCIVYKHLDEILAKASYTNDSGKRVTYSRYSNATAGIMCDYEWKTSWPKLVFEIEYIPFINTKLKLKQRHTYRHLVSAIDNSSNVQSDVSSFIKKSFEKNSQLGNDSLLFYARSQNSEHPSPVYRLGDYYIDEDNEKYILNYLEYENKPNCIMYKGILTKNYSNRNIHTIINREKRYYSLADSSQSVLRNEVYSRKFYLSLEPYYNSSILMLVKPFNVARFYAEMHEDGALVAKSGYLAATTIASKNIISHNVLFEDNIIFTTRVGEFKTGGYEMELLKYTNSYGELEYVSADFRLTSGLDLDVVLNCISMADDKECFIGKTLGASFNLLKDSREQLCLNSQNYIVNHDSNVWIDEDNIYKLLNSSFITIQTPQVGILLTGENILNFGKPIHELTSVNINYPCNISVIVDNIEVIKVDNYKGENLRLNLLGEDDGYYNGGYYVDYEKLPSNMFHYSLGGLTLYSTTSKWLASCGDLFTTKTFYNRLPLGSLIKSYQSTISNYDDAVFACVETNFTGQIPFGTNINLEMKGVAILKLTKSNYEEVSIYFTPSLTETYKHPTEENIIAMKFFVPLEKDDSGNYLYVDGAYVKNLT